MTVINHAVYIKMYMHVNAIIECEFYCLLFIVCSIIELYSSSHR